jgi:hypothetical protein
MTHRDHHPSPLANCMGCKVQGIGFDGGHTTRSTTDENRATVTEHRDGRQDVLVRAPHLRLRMSTTEERD